MCHGPGGCGRCCRRRWGGGWGQQTTGPEYCVPHCSRVGGEGDGGAASAHVTLSCFRCTCFLCSAVAAAYVLHAICVLCLFSVPFLSRCVPCTVRSRSTPFRSPAPFPLAGWLAVWREGDQTRHDPPARWSDQPAWRSYVPACVLLLRPVSTLPRPDGPPPRLWDVTCVMVCRAAAHD